MLRRAIRSAVLLILIQSHVAGAIGKVSRRERRATRAILNRLSPSIGDADGRHFFDSDPKRYPELKAEQRAHLLDATAKNVAQTIDALVWLLRENEIEAARGRLRELSQLLVRAARIDSAASRETYESVATVMYNSYLGGLPALSAGIAGYGGIVHQSFGAFLFGMVGFAVSTFGGAGTFTYFYPQPWLLRMPFHTTLTRLLSQHDDLAYFWRQVGRDLPDVASFDDLKRLIESELRGVTFEQACTSALLTVNTEKSEPST